MPTLKFSQEKSDIHKLLWQLRDEDPTQYHTLVKMHLSFATDLPTHQYDNKLIENPMKPAIKWNFLPLLRMLGTKFASKLIADTPSLDSKGVFNIYQIIKFLGKDQNIVQEGLFRKSGSLARQQELKFLLNSDCNLNLENGSYSAHDCASVLKSFLADLPEPLLQENHYQIHCKIAEMCKDYGSREQKDLARYKQVKSLRLLFLLLPLENYRLLKELLILLHKVASHQDQNKMSSKNLGTMFAPHILCPRKMSPNDLQYFSTTLSGAVAFMIENALQLFQVPLELEYDVRQYFLNKKRLKQQLSKNSLLEAPTDTIFTFIDRDLTAAANDKNVTEVALAELYAYVQSLPESARKRRLIKQFNEASGQGTPVINQSGYKKRDSKSRKLGDSIKRHLFSKPSKGTKLKNNSFNSKIKKANSEDLILSPVRCSPDLCFSCSSSEPDQYKTKSLDNLSFADEDSRCAPGPIVHPVFHPNTHLLKDIHQTYPSSLPSLSVTESSTPQPFSSSINLTEHNLSPMLFSPLCAQRTTMANAKEFQTAECVFSTPKITQEDSDSPITKAVIRACIPQTVMMTPRSRCPIFANSSSSLNSVRVQPNDSPVIANPTASLSSPYPRYILKHTNNLLVSHNPEGPDILNSDEAKTNKENAKQTVSTTSLFGNFFKHLSTSSLAHLASRLTSALSLGEVENCDHELSIQSPTVEQNSLNESLSNVFKEYLLSRILTDKPIDLSTVNTLEQECEDQPNFNATEDSAYGESNGTENSKSPASKGISPIESGVEVLCNSGKLSGSLLYCLDGNDPSVNSEMSSAICESFVGVSNAFISCSPNGRSQSILGNKQGTPVPNKDRESIDASSVAKEIIFETSF